MILLGWSWRWIASEVCSHNTNGIVEFDLRAKWSHVLHVVAVAQLPLDVVKMDKPLLVVVLTLDLFIEFKTAACEAHQYEEERESCHQEDRHMESIDQHYISKASDFSRDIGSRLLCLELAKAHIYINQESYLDHPLDDGLLLVQPVPADIIYVPVIALDDINAVIGAQSTGLVVHLAPESHVDH